jgi:hypothetical protein
MWLQCIFFNKYLLKKQCILNNVGNNVLFIYVRIGKKIGFRSLFRKCVAHTINKDSQPKSPYINHLQ